VKVEPGIGSTFTFATRFAIVDTAGPARNAA